MNDSIRLRRLLYGSIALLIAAAPVVVGLTGVADSTSRVLAQCQDVETEDSFSMNCAPAVMPDVSDQLTEAEVAEPGFNGNEHAGGGGGGGGGGHH